MEIINWKRIGKEWGKCHECWLAYERGIQHIHSLSCFKLGIPISSLKIPLEEFLNKVNNSNIVGKYSIFRFPLNVLSKGVVIIYFNSREEMLAFFNDIKEYVKDKPENRDRLFYNVFVNVDWLNGVNWRRGCPEYDKKFGDWRLWEEKKHVQ